MKKKFYLPFLLCLIFSSTYSQIIQTGGFRGQFGIDGDTRSGYTKYGNAPSPNQVDDWFSLPGENGKGVIDTANASHYKSLLQNNKNISFTQRMSVPVYSKVNGNLFLDALYARDFITRSSGRDSTSFVSASNGSDPARWRGGNTSVPAKSDIVDAFLHLRRNGGSANDSLWLFGGASTLSAANDTYVDIELFNKKLTYSRSNGSFTSAAESNGHTEWLFDASGKVTRIGDVLITIRYQTGQKPQVDVHIWVSRYSTWFANPSLFKFGNSFYNTHNSSFGYANIIPRSSNTVTGAGIVNQSSNTNRDTTYAGPWGTTRSNTSWSSSFRSKQFVEIGLNLTRIGIDPAQYLIPSSISCDRYFESVIFKSGSFDNSNSGCGDHEDVTLEDFAGPFELVKPGLNFSIRPIETLTCVRQESEIIVDQASCQAIYNWSTADGSILSSNVDSSTIKAGKKGTYKLSAVLAKGCPAIKSETITVLVDSISPVASADLGMTPAGELQLLGGDTAESNKLTPFGRSHGLQWEWDGPNGFNANCQNPIIDGMWAWGSYHLVLTEVRNGCKSSTTLEVSFKKAQGGSQAEELSPTVADNKITLAQNRNTRRVYLLTNQSENVNGRISIYNTAGQLLSEKNIQFAKGHNNVELSTGNSNQLKIVVVSINNRLVLSRKISF